MNRFSCLGLHPDYVSVALALLALDPNADIFVTIPDEQSQCGKEWRELAERRLIDQFIEAHPDQMLLFETEEQFQARRATAYRY